MALLDNSIDWFGALVTCGSFVVGTAYVKPEWPVWVVSLGTFTTFLIVTLI